MVTKWPNPGSQAPAPVPKAMTPNPSAPLSLPLALMVGGSVQNLNSGVWGRQIPTPSLLSHRALVAVTQDCPGPYVLHACMHACSENRRSTRDKIQTSVKMPPVLVVPPSALLCHAAGQYQRFVSQGQQKEWEHSKLEGPCPLEGGGQPGVNEGPEFPENRELDFYVKPSDFSMLATKSN